MPGGTFQTNGDVPREFQQSAMEMSDDSITSLDPGHHEWPAAAGQLAPGPAMLQQNTANLSQQSAISPRNVTNGVSPAPGYNENGMFHYMSSTILYYIECELD